jgi:hypothetical protein
MGQIIGAANQACPLPIENDISNAKAIIFCKNFAPQN